METQAMSSMWQDLLPGIHHDISLTHITAKLPWTALHELSSVSRTWQRAIQSREVYSERIRRQSTETLVVVKNREPTLSYYTEGKWAISLYSMREKTFYELPPIPQFASGISKYSHLISLDGKLYVLRPGPRYEFEWDNWDYINSANRPRRERCRQTYVLDLAGQRQWTSCTSVPEPEREYTFNIGCGFTGNHGHFVWGGCANWFRSCWHVCDAVEGEWTVEDREWRVAETSQVSLERVDTRYRVQLKFRVEGNNFSLWTGYGNTHTICVDDFNTKSSTLQHSVSWDEVRIESDSPIDICPCYILPVNNELFALVRWKILSGHGHDYGDGPYRNCDRHHGIQICYDQGHCFLQTKGFGTESKEIVWEKVPNSEDFHYDSDSSFSICPIEL